MTTPTIHASGVGLSFTVPSDVIVGTDLIVTLVAVNEIGADVPQPTGGAGGTWTDIEHIDPLSAAPGLRSSYRLVTSGDAGATISTTPPGGTSVGLWAVVRGASPSTPIDAKATGGWWSSQSSGTTMPAPTITTNHSNDLVIDFWWVEDSTFSALPATVAAGSAGSSSAITYRTPGQGSLTGDSATAAATTHYNLIETVAFTLMSAPLAPTLTAPANAVYEDLSGTPTFSWTYNPSSGNGSQNAYAFRRKVSGAGSYSYWNASTSSWQSTIVWNPSTVASLTFPAAAWADGSIYNWSVATQESVDSLQSPFASDFTVTAQTPPVVTVTAPTGTSANMTPAVTWTVSLAAGATQTGFRVVVYTAAQYTAGGFTPGTTTGVADSGVVNTTATTWTVPAGALVNGTTYRAYVQVTETGGETSTWAYTGWTLSVDTPAPPIITATAGTDPTTGLPLANLTVQATDNLLSVNDASFEGGIGSWGSLVNATLAQSTAQALDGSYSMAVTATAAADMSTTSGTYPVQVGQTYTAMAAFRAATTGRSVFVVLEWFNASAGLISSVNGTPVTDTTTGWTQATVTASAPTGSVTAAVKVYFTAPAASEVHYVDEAGIRPGSDTGWYRGGLVGSTTVAILRSDGLYVRGASTTNPFTIPSSQQTSLVDAELVPANGYTYIGSASVVISPTVTLTGPSSQASAQVTLTTTKWWQFDPTDLSTAIAAQVTDFNPQITEQAAAHIVLGQATPNVIANAMGGVDGTATFETFDSPTYLGLTKLLISQKTVFISDPFGDNQGVTYVRFGPQTGGMSGGSGLKAKDARLRPSTSSAPHHELSVSWVAQPRPSV